MIYLPGKGAISALISAALGVRMFWGLAVDFPFAMNASWICPLIGFLIYLPLGFAIQQAGKLSNRSVWSNLTSALPFPIVHGIGLLFVLILLYDASVTVRLLASSANLIALKDVTVHILIFPLALVVAGVALLGGDAVGNCARLWLKILPVFAVVLLTVQANHYRIGWITPILGDGINSILSGSIYCAGCLSLLSLSWLIAVPDQGKGKILFCTALPCLAVSILMLTQHMSFPAMINIPFTRAARIELILSNGRMSLSPQLLLDILWFGGLLQLISAEVVTAASYLSVLFSRLNRWWRAALLSSIVTLCAIYNPQWLQASAEFVRLMFLVIGGIFAGLLIFIKTKKGVNRGHVEA